MGTRSATPLTGVNALLSAEILADVNHKALAELNWLEAIRPTGCNCLPADSLESWDMGSTDSHCRSISLPLALTPLPKILAFLRQSMLSCEGFFGYDKTSKAVAMALVLQIGWSCFLHSRGGTSFPANTPIGG